MIITIHILPKIPRTKDDQTTKFWQIVEYKIRNISLETSHTKCGGEFSLRPISKRSKSNISLDQHSEVS